MKRGTPGRPPLSPRGGRFGFDRPAGGRLRAAVLLYPGVSGLDVLGIRRQLGGEMAASVRFVACSLHPVITETGLRAIPTTTVESPPQAVDLLFVPGSGREPGAHVEGQSSLLPWLARQAPLATLVAAVGCGTVLLARAGLLGDRRVASDEASRAVLAGLGALPVDAPVVQDGPFLTGRGASAGKDLALALRSALAQAPDPQRKGPAGPGHGAMGRTLLALA